MQCFYMIWKRQLVQGAFGNKKETAKQLRQNCIKDQSIDGLLKFIKKMQNGVDKTPKRYQNINGLLKFIKN